MVSVQFTVKGMSCGGCARSIERRLQATPGVQTAGVDLAAERADVTYDEHVTQPDALAQIIESLGFNVLDSPEP